MKFNRPDLVIGKMQQSKREKIYPYVLGGSIVVAIALMIIKEVCRNV